jgi:protein-S-isoprenylcysteine O-methyltransferase Ste14
MKSLFLRATAKFLAGVMIVGALLFLPAGTFSWFDGWLFMTVLFVPMFAAGIVMAIKNPSLLEKRLNAKEKEGEQKTVVALSGLMFVAAFAVAGLKFRFGWTVMPRWSVWAGTGVFLAAYLVFAEVLRENTYLSRTIEFQEDQKVIDTGLYGVVRHPMYSATLFLFISMGFVLGSVFSVAILLFYLPIIALRMKNEEEVLEKELDGYAEYKKRVKYRVIPFIW